VAYERQALRCLVVEDNPGDARLLELALDGSHPARFELHVTDRIEAALRELTFRPFDVVLLDLSLPDSQGLDTVRRIHEGAPQLPIVVTTGLDDEMLGMQAVKAGAQDYLVKGQVEHIPLHQTLRHAIARKQSAEALRESEERYQLAMSGARDGLWDWDVARDQIYYSPRWAAILGHAEDEITADPEEWLGRIHPDDEARVRRNLEEHMEGARDQFESEHRVRRKDGSYAWMLVRGVAVRDGSGKVSRMAGSITDVTDRRLAEDELLSHVSHELRTPLAAIHQFATILLDEITGPVNDEQRECLDTIERNANQLKAMIGDLMEITRITTGKLAIDPVPFGIAEEVVNVVDAATGNATEAGVVLRADVADGLPPVFGDRARVRQVMTNLVDNAIKFTPAEGRVSITVTRAADPGLVEVAVADSGCGIAPDQLQSVFERLHQANGGPETSRKGLGLGLFICRELVTRQGGRIWVESEVSEGSTFHFTLPVFSLVDLLRPVVTQADGLRSDVALLRIHLEPASPSKPLRFLDIALEETRRVVTRSVRPAEDILLPRLGPGDDGRTLCLFASTGADGAERIRSRLEERLTASEDLTRAGARARVEAIPLVVSGTEDDEALDALARDIASIVTGDPSPQKESDA